MCIPNMMATHLKVSFKRGPFADGLLPLTSRVSWCVVPPRESHAAPTCRVNTEPNAEKSRLRFVFRTARCVPTAHFSHHCCQGFARSHVHVKF